MDQLADDLFTPNPRLFDPRFVSPKGPNKDVALYIVGDAPAKDEVEEGLSLVGQVGKILDRAIFESNAAFANIRFFHSIPYRPVTKDMETRTAEPGEIKKYSFFVMKDIEKVRPKVILLIGRSAMVAFGIDMPIGKQGWRVLSIKVYQCSLPCAHYMSYKRTIVMLWAQVPQSH
jgi:uracil-DNA glycosylase family 4